MVLKFLDIRKGRLGRLDYFLLTTLTAAFYILLFHLILTHMEYNIPVLALFLSTSLYLFVLLQVKRLRDIGWNPWLCLITAFQFIILFCEMLISTDVYVYDGAYFINTVPYAIFISMGLYILEIIFGLIGGALWLFLLFVKSKDNNITKPRGQIK